MNDSINKIDEIQMQTNTNVQEKANLISEIATHLYAQYKPHEYRKVIPPKAVHKNVIQAIIGKKRMTESQRRKLVKLIDKM